MNHLPCQWSWMLGLAQKLSFIVLCHPEFPPLKVKQSVFLHHSWTSWVSCFLKPYPVTLAAFVKASVKAFRLLFSSLLLPYSPLYFSPNKPLQKCYEQQEQMLITLVLLSPFTFDKLLNMASAFPKYCISFCIVHLLNKAFQSNEATNARLSMPAFVWVIGPCSKRGCVRCWSNVAAYPCSPLSWSFFFFNYHLFCFFCCIYQALQFCFHPNLLLS